MQNSHAILLQDLKKTYVGRKSGEHKEALNGVSIEIPHGSIFGLLGPNGAGKSTIINIIAGLTNKTSGKVIINGIDQDVDARGTRFQVGVVPQEVVLEPFFSTAEMLHFYSGYYGVRKKDRRVDEILKALSLSDKAHLNSRKLSGGMRRRVLIAKALVHTPPILILDEPTAGVDVELRTQLWDYVRHLHSLGTTVLLTTHYLEEAEQLCDHIAIINHGRIIANDTTERLIGTIDQKCVILQVAPTLDRIPPQLARFETKLIAEDRISISYKRRETSMEELLHFVKESGLTITDLSTVEPDLEDAFRHLVGTQNHATA